MASEEEQKMDGAGKGFAGLLSMLSDVDAAVTHAEKEGPEPTPNDAPAGGSRPAPQPQPQPASEPEPSHEPYQQAAQLAGGSSAGKWLLGIGAIIGLIWLLSESGNKSSPSARTYGPSAQPPSRPTEERPRLGTNLVHGPAQLRYCIAERIRLDAAQGTLNNYEASDVGRFNAMVVDYNGRCGEFRYRRNSLESAKSDVERFRQMLESEGRSRITQPPQQTSYSTSQAPVYQPTPSPTGPDSAFREIQQRLNALGYDAGSPDGLEGPKTRFAITAFQKDYGIYPDGVASTEVLAALIALSPTCRYKAVMSEADYRNCEISSPQLQ